MQGESGGTCGQSPRWWRVSILDCDALLRVRFAVFPRADPRNPVRGRTRHVAYACMHRMPRSPRSRGCTPWYPRDVRLRLSLLHRPSHRRRRVRKLHSRKAIPASPSNLRVLLSPIHVNTPPLLRTHLSLYVRNHQMARMSESVLRMQHAHPPTQIVNPHETLAV